MCRGEITMEGRGELRCEGTVAEQARQLSGVDVLEA